MGRGDGAQPVDKAALKKVHELIDEIGLAPSGLAALAASRRLREAAEALELTMVAQVRAQGATWTEIGTVYGTSKQGAQQRFRAAVRGKP